MDVQVHEVGGGHTNPRESQEGSCGSGALLSIGTRACAQQSPLIPRPAGLPTRWAVMTGDQRVAITCAQIAIIPRNNASDAKAAASSIIARNMEDLPDRTNEELSSLYVLESSLGSGSL
jgi:hypothetical protein